MSQFISCDVPTKAAGCTAMDASIDTCWRQFEFANDVAKILFSERKTFWLWLESFVLRIACDPIQVRVQMTCGICGLYLQYSWTWRVDDISLVKRDHIFRLRIYPQRDILSG
jgi:hypothetical protein